MLKYILRKLLLVIPLLIGVVTMVFFLIELSPGDVADKFFTPETTPEVRQQIIAKYGLDKPAWYRYLLLLKNLAVLEFGTSIAYGRDVTTLIMEYLPNTLILSTVTLLVVYPFGVLLGTIQGVKQGTIFDTLASVISLFFYSMPSFWLALMLQLQFSLNWGLLPTSGMHDGVMYDYMSPTEQIFDPIAAAEASAAFTVGEVLHPQRMARLVLYGSMGDYPDLEEVVDRLIDVTWGADVGGDEYRQRILHVVQRTVIDQMMQQATLADQIRAGKATLSGNPRVLLKLAATLVNFDPLFEMMPGTK